MTGYYSFTSTWKECDRLIIAAIVGGAYVGTVIVDYDNQGNKQANLWNLQVNINHRRSGIAKELLHQACRHAAERGCKEIWLEWSAYDTDGWTLDWYKRNGFEVTGGYREATVKMTKRLKKGGRNA